jgi:hypothetical protein
MLAPGIGLWTDAQDSVQAADGARVTSKHATLWRWRTAFQNDFAARMDWAVTPAFKDANHPPQVLLNGTDTAAPLEITACVGESVRLNASGSRDPDGQPLAWRWWRYAEPTGSLPVSSPRIDTTDAIETTVILPTLKTPPPPQFLHHVAYRFHVIVEATDNGMPPLTRYRRVVITVPRPHAPTEASKACHVSP